MVSPSVFTPSFLLRVMLFISLTLMLLGHNLFDRKVLFANFVVLAIVNFRYISSLIIRFLNNLPLFFVISWCLLSVTWSSWIYKSFEEAIIQLMMVLTCLMIANTYSTSTIFKLLKISACLVVLVNVFSVPILFSGAFSDAGMTGIYGHKNNLGLVMAICLIVLLFDFLEFYSKKTLLFMILTFTILILSMSKTSLILFFFSSLIAVLFHRAAIVLNEKSIVLIKFFGFFITFFFAAFVIFNRYDILDYLYYNMDEEFMTGRGRLWLTMLLHAENNIVYGFGFNSVWGNGEFSEIYYTDLFNYNPLWVDALSASDGGYIDLILALGGIGFFIFIYFIFNSIVMLLASNKSSNFSVMFTLFIFVVFHNFSETTFLLSTNILWFITILVSFLAFNEAGKIGNLNV